MKRLTCQPEAAGIGFPFVGGGAQQGKLQQAIAETGLRNTQFRPYQPRDKLVQSLSAADVHLISLRPAMAGLIVPSKFYGIAAAGRPTAFSPQPQSTTSSTDRGGIARLLRAYDCGFSVAPGDGEMLANQLLALMRNGALCRATGARAWALFETRFDKNIAMNHWEELLERLH